MLPRPFRLRRGRRTDFVAVMEILAASGLPTPPPDRAALRRFRKIVADLGGDLYVATTESAIVGVVHATYARQLAGAPRAQLEMLVVAPAVRRQHIASALVALISERARRRGCDRLYCVPEPTSADARAFFANGNWQGRAGGFSTSLVQSPR